MNDIPKIKIHVELNDGEIFDRDISSDLQVTPETLSESLQHQAALYAYYTMIYQKAQLHADLKQHELDSLIAEFWEKARVELSDSRITRDRIDAMINRMPAVQQAKRETIKAQADARKLWGLVKALDHKKDMVVNMCYNMRHELSMLGVKTISLKSKSTEYPESGLEERG